MRGILIGIDEAGRAPLAGPVSVGLVAVPEGFDVQREFKGVKDSKQLTPERREEIYEQLIERKRNGDVSFKVVMTSHTYIDECGITRAVKDAIVRGLNVLKPDPDATVIMLDGLLSAPSQFLQRTVIGGDDIVPVVSLASVAAKVERDRLMRRMAKKYPGFGFESHKGYGTRKHWSAIQTLGLCEIHRRTYCKVDWTLPLKV